MDIAYITIEAICTKNSFPLTLSLLFHRTYFPEFLNRILVSSVEAAFAAVLLQEGWRVRKLSSVRPVQVHALALYAGVGSSIVPDEAGLVEGCLYTGEDQGADYVDDGGTEYACLSLEGCKVKASYV